MEKDQIALILEEIGTLLEISGENSFRCSAYHAGARALRQLEGDLSALVRDKQLQSVPGIGKTLAEKISTLAVTGKLDFYEELRAATPAGLLQIVRLPSVGPKKAMMIYQKLGVSDVAGLKAACLDGRVATIKGFGAKTQQKILEGIEFLGQVGQRVRIDQAEAIARAVLEELGQAPGMIRMELCGSLRRRRETSNDLDILASAVDAAVLLERFAKLRGVVEVIGKGETKCSVTLDRSRYGGASLRINADLRVVRDDQFAFALHYFTGSKEHNVAVRARAQKIGLKLNEYELAGMEKSIPCKDEAELFKVLGMDYVCPEMRENTGEIEAAAAHQLPRLVCLDDLAGTFHCHTNWSDGAASIEEMAEAARALGLKYLGIADHSQSLTIANGLTPDRVRMQHAEIDRLNAQMKGFRLFKGTECDILPDGQLDFGDDVLASFDYVVASVHSYFNQSEEEMTARIVRAVSHPLVTMLGHATGRVLLRRDGYKVNLEQVLRATAQHGTMVEINAHPQRLDLDWVHCKRAKSIGVQLVINPDAHRTEEIGLLRFGIDVARRGWLEPKNVFNTQSAERVAPSLRDKTSRVVQAPQLV
jgi:DNA polymerase (family 10)